MTKTFKLRPEAFQRDVRDRTILVILVEIAMAVAFILFALWGANIGLSDLADFRIWTALLSTAGQTLLILGGVGIFLVFAVRSGMKARRGIWDSFEVEIADDYVARRQMNLPEIRLQRDEIASLENAGAVLSVHSTNKYRVLNIPKLLDGYDEVRETLLSWGKPMRSTQGRTRVVSWTAGALSLVGFLLVIFAYDPVLLAIATLGMIGMMAYVYWYIGRWEGHDPKARRSYLMLIAVIAFLGACKLLFFGLAFLTPAPK